ncbi:MAG TPA: bifunctional DNA-formamidopyrimidine glycosylase/DNA-(apurinic or apyrimidinic site) lyase [Acidimicrobiales bacterium]|nr:bifunctional DNA-formamidopyrimidine glycosylase/DNA-(apurinic or apyrimidinic site) lyase [Acidimicrobiales bacterium]
MRELPEVETIRRGFDKEVVGKKVKTVDVTGMSAVGRHPNKKHFAHKLEGAKITGVERRGTALVAPLDTDDVLLIELGSSGTLRKSAAKDEITDDTQVVITFTQGGQLRLLDGADTARMSVLAADDLATEHPELASLGLDPVESPISWVVFGELLRRHDTKLRPLLLDQRIIAGLGDLYVDEILFASGLRPDRTAGTLSSQEVRRLYRSVVEIMHDAMKYRGTSLDGDGFTDIYGGAGDYGDHLQVHGREKQACRRCRTPIVKARVANATAFLCEQCQV